MNPKNTPNGLRLLICIVMLAPFYASLNAQSGPQSDPDESTCDGQVIPFRFVDQLMIVEGVVNDVAGYLLIDLGTKHVMLNAHFFNGRPSHQRILGPDGQNLRVRECRAVVQVGSIRRQLQNVPVADLNGIFWSKQTPIIALIGTQFFTEQAIVIDYQAREFHVRTSEDFSFVDLGPKNAMHWQSRLASNGLLPYVALGFEGRAFRATLDTGAEINVMDVQMAKRYGLWSPDLPTTVVYMFGGAIRTRVVEASLVLPDGSQTRSMPFALIPLYEINDLVPTAVHGILGAPFMRQFEAVGFNFASGEVGFWQLERPRRELAKTGQ